VWTGGVLELFPKDFTACHPIYTVGNVASNVSAVAILYVCK
jgi:hypothetical protein